MKASVIKGQVTYIDTERNIIEITDRKDGECTESILTSETCLPYGVKEFSEIIAKDVEVIEVDGKVDDINWIYDE